MKYIRILVFLIMGITILILNNIYGWSELLTKPEQLTIMQETLEHNRNAAFLLYIALTAVGCVVLALPGIIFAIAAGVLFGPVWGTAACLIGATLGAAFAFLAARYFLRDSIKPMVLKNKHLKRFLYDEGNRNALFLLMLTRLVPLFPYNLQNFAYGVTDIPFLPYVLYSFLFMLPGTAVYTVAAAGVIDPARRVPYLIFSVVLLAGVLLAAFVIKKKNHI